MPAGRGIRQLPPRSCQRRDGEVLLVAVRLRARTKPSRPRDAERGGARDDSVVIHLSARRLSHEVPRRNHANVGTRRDFAMYSASAAGGRKVCCRHAKRGMLLQMSMAAAVRDLTQEFEAKCAVRSQPVRRDICRDLWARVDSRFAPRRSRAGGRGACCRRYAPPAHGAARFFPRRPVLCR